MGLFKTFGKNPAGKSLEAMQRFPNYKKDGFENLSPTQMMMQDTSFLKMTWRFFNKPADTKPPVALPSVKTDLKKVTPGETLITWFGHSSYLIQINGKNILVDPVLSGYASPFNMGVKGFAGTDVYRAEDMPEIDLLLITHDHFDHLDHRTVLKLKPKIKSICTSAGVGSHLIYWGFDPAIITEIYWWEHVQIFDDASLTAAPARHFSGRTFNRNKTLWSSFILKTANQSIYIGADSGYDSHFKTIGEKFGPFDLAILETGQYNTQWPLIHMMPEEAVQATIDLGARSLLPVHWGKFALAFHPWNEPMERVLAKASEINIPVITPMIGEQVVLGKYHPEKKWWRSLD